MGGHDLLQSLRINALFCDSNGVMWVATRNGLLKYENGFEVVFQPNPGHENSVTCLSANSQNTLVFVCNNRLYQVKNNKVEAYPLKKEWENTLMLAAFDRDDNLWLVTTTSVSIKKRLLNTHLTQADESQS